MKLNWYRRDQAGVVEALKRGERPTMGCGPLDELISAPRPVIVAWRLLSGEASEKGKEAGVTRILVEQAIALGGAGCIDLQLMDALYADGPLLAWLKYKQHIDAIVPIPSDRELHRDLVGLVEGGLLSFTPVSYTCTRQGHQQRRTLEFAWQDGLTGWDSFVSAAVGYDAVEPCLWGCLIRSSDAALDGDKPLDADQDAWTIVSTRSWRDGMAAWQGYRPRWHIENDVYRELKEGWRLESQRWGRDEAVQRARITLTCLAFNTAQVYLSQAGARLASRCDRSMSAIALLTRLGGDGVLQPRSLGAITGGDFDCAKTTNDDLGHLAPSGFCPRSVRPQRASVSGHSRRARRHAVRRMEGNARLLVGRT